MSLSVRSCYPGDLVVPPEALEAWCNSVEARLAALEAGQSNLASAGHGQPDGLHEQMRDAAVEATGYDLDDWGPYCAAMIRAVAAYIERWACCDMIATEQLMNLLESQAKIAERD